MKAMKIEVHIKDKMFTINCGIGAQKIRWLGDVAIYRYDHFFGMLTGTPKGVKCDTGALLPMDGIISEHLEDEMHVWVILKEDMQALGLEKDKKKGNTINIKQGTGDKNAFRIRPGTAANLGSKK